MSDFVNYGVADVKVNFLTKLPYITKDPNQYTLDVDSSSFDISKGLGSSILAETIDDPGGTFSVAFPARKKIAMGNILNREDSSSKTSTYGFVKTQSGLNISWTPKEIWNGSSKSVDADGNTTYSGTVDSGVDATIKGILEHVTVGKGAISKEGWVKYGVITPKDKTFECPNDYDGPQWAEATYALVPTSSDTEKLDNFYNMKGKKTKVKLTMPAKTFSIDKATPTNTNSFAVICQKVPKGGLCWGIKSSDFLKKNMPFWVTIKKYSSAPSTPDRPTFVALKFGEFMIFLNMNEKPKLYDSKIGKEVDFQNDLSTIWSSDNELEIGVMTIAGRLIVFVNKNMIFYTRIEGTIENANGDNKVTAPKLGECEIAAGALELYASNISGVVYAAPMTFASASYLLLPVVRIHTEGEDGVSTEVKYSAINEKGEIIQEPVCVIPKSIADHTNEYKDAEGNTGKSYGVDCKEFKDGASSANPSGFAFHKLGQITWGTLEDFGATGDTKNQDLYILEMLPQILKSGGDWEEPGVTSSGDEYPMRCGCPYFFRLKGAVKSPETQVSYTQYDASDYVMNVDESCNSPDWSHIKRSCNIVLYNKDGIWDNLKSSQFGVELYWKWNGKDGNNTYKKTFTGVVTHASVSQVPGKELLTLQCEDYCYILQGARIVNSPIYDGMLGWGAVKDVVRRAGVQSFTKYWDNDEDYFLPSGYTWTSPKHKLAPFSTFFEGIKTITALWEAYFWFDEDGKFNLAYLPGGILGQTAGTISSAFSFYSDPSKDENVILDDKNLSFDLDAPVNLISAQTLDRDTKDIIIYALPAGVKYKEIKKGEETGTTRSTEDILLYRKPHFEDNGMFGDKNTLVSYVHDLAQRMFYPIRSVNFKYVSGSTILMPLKYIKVDDIPFRVIGIKRNFDSEQNSFTQSVEAEWLGGK